MVYKLEYVHTSIKLTYKEEIGKETVHWTSGAVENTIVVTTKEIHLRARPRIVKKVIYRILDHCIPVSDRNTPPEIIIKCNKNGDPVDILVEGINVFRPNSTEIVQAIIEVDKAYVTYAKSSIYRNPFHKNPKLLEKLKSFLPQVAA